MRLEEWYKRLESFEKTKQQIVTAEPETEVQATTKMEEPVPVVQSQMPRAGIPSVQILPQDTPTVSASAAAETLPQAAQKFAENAGVSAATFRTASAPKSPAKSRENKNTRAGDKESLDLFAQPSTAPPPAPPMSRESREELMARLLDPILTLEEAAQLLGVCPTTVRRWTNKGVLQHYRTSGNQRRFRLSHVAGFLGDDGGPTKPKRTGTLHNSQDEERPVLTLSSPKKGGAEFSGHAVKAG